LSRACAPKEPLCPAWTWPGTVVRPGDATGSRSAKRFSAIGQGSFGASTRAHLQDKLAPQPSILTPSGQPRPSLSPFLTALRALRDAGCLQPATARSSSPARPRRSAPRRAGLQCPSSAGHRRLQHGRRPDLVTSIGADPSWTTTRMTSRTGPIATTSSLDIRRQLPLARLRRALTPAGRLVLAGGRRLRGRWTGMSASFRALPAHRSPPASHHAHLPAAHADAGNPRPYHRAASSPGHRKTTPLHSVPDSNAPLTSKPGTPGGARSQR